MRLHAWNGKKLTALFDWRESSAVYIGQPNRLGIMANGNTLTMYVNGLLVGEVEDDTYPFAGRFGLFVGTNQTPNFLVAFDDLLYWALP